MKTIRKWFLFGDFGEYFFDSSGWNVTSQELCLCIDKQIYGVKPCSYLEESEEKQ